MIEHSLIGTGAKWRSRRRNRPVLLAVFSYRYDAELVPDLLENIKPVVDGWVAFDDRASTDLFSDEPQRRRLLIERASELGASWVLAIDPDERIERGAATHVRSLISRQQRIVWELNLRDMFTSSSYRADGVWGAKMQGRIFPVFDGALNSEQPLHGAWCAPTADYAVLPAGLNLYHLKMLDPDRRKARRDLYQHLDPTRVYQQAGYDYLVEDGGAVFERIPPGRDFFPAHRESGGANLHMARVRPGLANTAEVEASIREVVTIGGNTSLNEAPRSGGSQLGQLSIAVGAMARHDSKLAVVVISLRAPQSLAKAVKSLIEQDTPAEIIVVNSGGGDAGRILEGYLKSIVLIELSEPVYVGAARNIGIQYSRAPFVAFLASDCTARPGWVAERLRAHMDGECAVASVVDNDKPNNPVAWAAHLATYGHRMAGVSQGENAFYGASYDRVLFDRYGYFSEALRIGEDSDFHARFRRADRVRLFPAIRTAHENPSGLPGFLTDQTQRGLRARHMADFLGVPFTLRYIAQTTGRRITRPLSYSIKYLQGSERLVAIASWPLLPIGAGFYMAGMVASHVKARIAERAFLRASKSASLRSFEPAIAQVEKAIKLRPGTARYQLALSALLRDVGRLDESVREARHARQLDRQAPENFGVRHVPATVGDDLGRSDGVHIRIVVVVDAPPARLAELLEAISLQHGPGSVDVLVAEPAGRSNQDDAMQKIRNAYGGLATFVPLTDLEDHIRSREAARERGDSPSFVAVMSCSCIPPPDWLGTLQAHVMAYPEVDLFHGDCRPVVAENAGLIERVAYHLGFYPRVTDREGFLCFAHAANWACNSSLLRKAGGFIDDEGKLRSLWTVSERVLMAGGSWLNAPDWQTGFRMDRTLGGLLRRFYLDGYYGARHASETSNGDVTIKPFSPRLRGRFASVWKFAAGNMRVWRFTNRSAIMNALVLVMLLMIGTAREVGFGVASRRSLGRLQGAGRND